MKISFLWDWEATRGTFYQTMTAQDGLWAALRELERRGHEIRFVTGGPKMVFPHPYFDLLMGNIEERAAYVKEFNPDVILTWEDTTRPTVPVVAELGKPMACCFAGGDPFRQNYALYDHFFVESQDYEDALKARGTSVSRAFGVDTDLFMPRRQVKAWDAVFPAVFASWKRHILFARASTGMKFLACGWPHEMEAVNECLNRGVAVLPHVPSVLLPDLFGQSWSCVITSNDQGGSQRTVLEAMACNCPLVVMEDSFKTTEFVREGGGEIVEPMPEAVHEAVERLMLRKKIYAETNTRDYVLSKWTHRHYADALETGLKNIL